MQDQNNQPTLTQCQYSILFTEILTCPWHERAHSNGDAVMEGYNSNGRCDTYQGRAPNHSGIPKKQGSFHAIMRLIFQVHGSQRLIQPMKWLSQKTAGPWCEFLFRDVLGGPFCMVRCSCNSRHDFECREH